MLFNELRDLIRSESKNENTFISSSEIIQKQIFSLDKSSIIQLISAIGAIPEDIDHDSTEEKLYAKATDILLSKSLQELGLKSTVIQERANCADVIAKSDLHNYTLVGDAKAFRLSRTAKNQKDFNVKSMSDWRGDNDYAVLVSPYFQYPKSNSQIYGQALNGNVCLLSWEHLQFLLIQNIKETKKLNLSKIWNLSSELSEVITIKDQNKNLNFHELGNQKIFEHLNLEFEHFDNMLRLCKDSLILRGKEEISFWENSIEGIKKYSKDKAISELVKALKINEKIKAINKYLDALREKHEK